MAPNQGVQLSPRDMEILAKAWQCFDEAPKINWQKLAEVANFKNAATARACFTPIKKKLAAASGVHAPAESGEPTAAAKGRGKRKAENQKAGGASKKTKASMADLVLSSTDDDGDDYEYQDEKPKRGSKKTPASRKKAQPSLSRKAAVPASVEDEDSDAANAKAKADLKLEAEESQESMFEDEA
ncbi:hypothetical protein F5Y06DRAFT_281093 [Hypoxylon sp. FL0890]|nr:hypothetical protein F5Y06DRAFT_281093 [Hypoxylon sp. FL0890]